MSCFFFVFFFFVVVVAVMMVLVVVVMIVLVVVVDGSGRGCDSVCGGVLFSFISYEFKSSVYFEHCYKLCQSTKKKQ